MLILNLQEAIPLSYSENDILHSIDKKISVFFSQKKSSSMFPAATSVLRGATNSILLFFLKDKLKKKTILSEEKSIFVT